MTTSARFLGIASISAFLTACGGGGGGGGGTTPVQPGTLTFVSSVPMSGASNQSCSVAPKVTYNKSVSAATATSTNITLTHGGVAEPFAVAVSGADITVTPNRKLTKLVAYTLTIGTGLRGTGGESPGSGTIINFTCEGTLKAAAKFPKVSVDSNAGTASTALDPNGNGFTVWNQIDDGIFSVWARRYTAAGGWGTPEIIEHQTVDAGTPMIGMDAAGNALVIFLVSNGNSGFSIYATRWTAADGWGTETRIDAMPGDAEYPQIAVNAAGAAVASWYQTDADGFFRAVGNFYTPGTGWGTATVLDTGMNALALNPRNAIDPAGNAMVIWQERGGPWGSDIWSRRWVAGSGWESAPVHVEENDTGSALSPRVKLDANGNGIAVWYQYDGVFLFNAMANRYIPGTGWGTPQVISNGFNGVVTPRLEMNANGDVLAAWVQTEGTLDHIWGARYTVAGGWTNSLRIVNVDAGNATTPWTAIDAAGNGLVIWQQSDANGDHLWSSRAPANGGYGVPQRVDGDDAVNVGSSSLTMDAAGNAVITWDGFDGPVFSLWGAIFD